MKHLPINAKEDSDPPWKGELRVSAYPCRLTADHG